MGRPKKKADRDSIPHFDGTLGWFFNILGVLTEELAVTRDRDLRQDIRAVSQAGLAAKNLWDTTSIEREVEELRAQVKEILSHRQHGTRLEGRDTAAAEPAGPASPIH